MEKDLVFKKDREGLGELAKILVGRHLHWSYGDNRFNIYNCNCVITKDAVVFKDREAFSLGLYGHQTYCIIKAECHITPCHGMLSFELVNIHASLRGFVDFITGGLAGGNVKKSNKPNIEQCFLPKNIKLVQPRILLVS